jgi:hypothetical protein
VLYISQSAFTCRSKVFFPIWLRRNLIPLAENASCWYVTCEFGHRTFEPKEKKFQVDIWAKTIFHLPEILVGHLSESYFSFTCNFSRTLSQFHFIISYDIFRYEIKINHIKIWKVINKYKKKIEIFKKSEAIYKFIQCVLGFLR